MIIKMNSIPGVQTGRKIEKLENFDVKRVIKNHDKMQPTWMQHSLVLNVFLLCIHASCVLLPPSQIIRHFKNLGESKNLKFDQIYMIR
jgi:hypothetical protein